MAADYEFVVALSHLLNRNTLKMPYTRVPGYGFFDRAKSLSDFRGISQIELHSIDIGLVSDGFRVELYNDGITNVGGGRDSGIFGTGYPGRHTGNAIGGEQLLRLHFG